MINLIKKYWPVFLAGFLLGAILTSLQVQLLSPLFPIYSQAKGLTDILNSSQIYFLRSAAVSIFVVSAAILSTSLFTKMKCLTGETA